MKTLTIVLDGVSTLNHVAERGILFLNISSEGSDRELVSHEVTTTSNQIRQTFTDLAPKTETGAATLEAPVTKFSTGAIRSWKSDHRHLDEKSFYKQHHASVSFEAIFRDFETLGRIATSFLAMPHVDITRIEWRLTDPTQTKLVSKSRKAALLDAIEKAKDYAEVVQREVIPVEITENGSSFIGMTMQTANSMRTGVQTSSSAGFTLEPEDVQLKAYVKVKFMTE